MTETVESDGSKYRPMTTNVVSDGPMNFVFDANSCDFLGHPQTSGVEKGEDIFVASEFFVATFCS
jgi:hypothetical protein